MAKAAAANSKAGATSLREVVTIGGLEDADRAMTELAELSVKIDESSAIHNGQINELQSQGADAVRPLVARKIALMEGLTRWAQEIYPSLTKKTLEFTAGQIATREGSESVKFLPGESMETVVAKLNKRPSLQHLVKITESVDLADLKEIDEKLHEALGFYVDQAPPSVTVKLNLIDFVKLAQAKAKESK